VEDNGEIEFSDIQHKLKGFEIWGVNGFRDLRIQEFKDS
jgi:hypothetical protein